MLSKENSLHGSGNSALENRSLFRKIGQNNYQKDMKIRLFKHKINKFFISIIKQFFLLVDPKHIKDFHNINIDLKPTIIDL
jgi:hypothetical protein